MVVRSPCDALIERAKLTIDLILTWVLAASCLRLAVAVGWHAGRDCLRRPPGGGPLVFRPPYPSGLCLRRIQSRPLLGLKNRSLIFLRRDDLITHASQREVGNWMTSSRENKACVSPPPTPAPTQSNRLRAFKNHVAEAGKSGRAVGVEC